MTESPNRFLQKHHYMASVATLVLALGLIWLAGAMLWSDLFFAQFYARGVPLWSHTILGLVALGSGAAGFVQLVRRVGLRRIVRFFWWRALAGLFLLVLLGVVSYLAWQRFRPLPPVAGASRESVAYLSDALWYLEHYSIWRDRVDWTKVRAESFSRIENAKTPKDTYLAIVQASRALRDNHTQFLPPNWRSEQPDTKGLSEERRRVLETRIPEGRLTAEGMAYVLVPWFEGQGSGSIFFLQRAEKAAYVNRMREILRALDSRKPCGWIVDLRRDPGGNVWPMLDALSPLIGDGRVFSIDMPQFGRRTDAWIIAGRASSGAPMFGGLGLIGPAPLKLQSASAPVALLIGPFTASAGEALLISFLGRPNTRTFGQPTFGVPTATQGVTLSDGAELMITIGRDVDRTGRWFDDKIEPDERVEGIGNDENEPVMLAAAKWIRTASKCTERR